MFKIESLHKISIVYVDIYMHMAYNSHMFAKCIV